MEQSNRDPATGEIRGIAGLDRAVGQHHGDLRCQADADLGAALLFFPGHCRGHAEDHDIEAGPNAVHRHRARMRPIPQPVHPRDMDQAGDGHEQSNQVHHQQEDERVGNPDIEIRLFHHPALGGHVELAHAGIDHGQDGGQKDVGSQYGLVNLIPKRVPMLSLNARVGAARQHQVRQGKGHNRRPIAGHVAAGEDQVQQRSGEKDQPRQRIHEVHHGVEVAQPLRQAESAGKQRIVQTQDLRHPPRPAHALTHVAGETLGSQSGSLWNIDIGRVPAVLLHGQRSMRVFCNRLGCDTADFRQGTSAQHGAGAAEAAEESRIPEVIAVLHDTVKQLAFVGNGVELLEIALEWIGRVEVVRRLQQAQFPVAQKPAHRHLQKAARGHVVAIEDGHVRRVRLAERAVDVARFCALVVVARHVTDVGRLGKGAEVLPLAVIEKENVQFFRRPVDVARRQCGVAHHAKRLIVGWNQQVDLRRPCRIFRQGRGHTMQRPDSLQITEHQDYKRIDLGADQHQDEAGVERSPAVAGVGKEQAHGMKTPIAIAAGGKQ